MCLIQFLKQLWPDRSAALLPGMPITMATSPFVNGGQSLSKGVLDGVWGKYEKPFQLGFTFMRLCQLQVVPHIVPSTGWNASQKGRVAYLSLQTIWMWESSCSVALHADHFASILHWEVFFVCDSVFTTHRHTLLSIGMCSWKVWWLVMQ